MKLSIIILTWNSKNLLRICLESIYSNTRTKDYEIIVVDNASYDKTCEMLNVSFPKIRIIRNETNRGVAPARNQGLAVARGEYLLILDVDTVIEDGALDVLMKFMENNSAVGLVGPKLVYPDGELQYSCRKFPTVPSKLLRRIPLRLANKLLVDEEYRAWDHASVQEVDYVIGACQLIRREAFEEVGELDDKMFYGPEDVDYCLRLRKAGWKVVYNPETKIIHNEQRVTRKKLFSIVTWRHIKALVRYFRKHKYYFSREKIYTQFRENRSSAGD